MGKEQEYLCKSCGKRAVQNVGSGMTYQLVRCESCGIEKNIPRSRYQEILSDSLGLCDCGGTLSLVAPLRCPQCGSTDVEATGEGLVIDYD